MVDMISASPEGAKRPRVSALSTNMYICYSEALFYKSPKDAKERFPLWGFALVQTSCFFNTEYVVEF